jgi:hypothetical protein
MVAHRMPFFVGAMLGKDTAQINLAGLGGAVRLFTLASGQLLAAHGDAGAIPADIHHRCLPRAG